METKPILLVEDDKNDVKLMLASISEAHRKNLSVAQNGKEALDYLFYQNQYSDRKVENPGIIVLDLNIPLLDGFEVLQAIRSDSSLRSIPVVAFSSSTYDLDIKKCYDLGVNSYVVKPMDFVQYKKTVRQIIKFWVDINQAPVF